MNKRHGINPKINNSQSRFFLIIKIAIVCLLAYTIYAVYYPHYIHEQKFQKSSPFVIRRGPNLILENDTFHIIGVNDYGLAYENNNTIDQTFNQLHNAGVNTIRFWLFDDGDPNGFQPNPGSYNESRFKQADYVLFEAKKYNMKVIPVLVNNWTDYGGKDQYLKWVGINPSSDENAFYTDNQVTSLFKQYISYIFSRNNTYTHITYANDPTILGWDIMNEPRSTNQNAMNTWLIDIATYIKQHDPNHLVFAGTDVATSPAPYSDESINLCNSPAIDICSIHLYLFNSANNQPVYNSYDETIQFMQTQKNYADKINKPLLLEEFGVGQDTLPFGEDPLSVMQQIINYSNQQGLSGFLVWNWSQTTTSPFTFSPQGNSQGEYSLTDLEKLLH